MLTVRSVEPTTSMNKEVMSRRSSVRSRAATRGMLRVVPPYRSACPSRGADAGPSLPLRGRCQVLRMRSFAATEAGLATIEYIIGAAVVLGTLVIGVQAWNNGLVTRLEALV